jgi:hypothetical protein
MAMDGSKMGKEIAEAIMNSSAPADVKAQVTALWEKIGGAIVLHIQTNAEVPTAAALGGKGQVT